MNHSQLVALGFRHECACALLARLFFLLLGSNLLDLLEELLVKLTEKRDKVLRVCAQQAFRMLSGFLTEKENSPGYYVASGNFSGIYTLTGAPITIAPGTYNYIALPAKEQNYKFTTINIPLAISYTIAKWQIEGGILSSFIISSKKEKEDLSNLIKEYLATRQNLKALYLLNDSRRHPEVEEITLQRNCFEEEVPLQIIVTKCDKIKNSELVQNIKAISTGYHLEKDDVIQSGEKISTQKVIDHILSVCQHTTNSPKVI